MKGKVELVTTQRTGDSDRYEVSLTITVKKGLTYERSDELMKQLWAEYKGKMVEIWPLITEVKEAYLEAA